MIVVVGGAGYIGSVVVESLESQNYDVAVIDDLSEGHREALPEEVELYEADLADRGPIEDIVDRHEVDGVMHFAARALVGESVEQPVRYWNQNVRKSIRMFNNWIDAGVRNFIFSSTAATYGEPEYLPIDEEHAQNPINPYGRTKLACEWFLDDIHEARDIQSVSLRYFNAAGAGDRVGEDHDPETHLIPNLLEAAQKGEPFHLFGTNYDTRDGTCLRDFVHVKNLADAHRAAFERLNELGCEQINLGTEDGTTVREVVDAVGDVTKEDFPVVEDDPRPGDPAKLVASNRKARELLDWEPRRDLQEIIRDAWEWKQKHPDGY